MATALRPVPIQSVESQTPTLACVLYMLGIAVYPTEQVEAYKTVFRKRVVRQTWIRELTGAFVAFAIAGVLSLYAIATDSWIMAAGSWALFVFFFRYGFVYISMARENMKYTAIEWESRPIGRNEPMKNLPKDAAKLVRQLRKQLPAARFYVERLSVDPFLWVHYAEQRYCIAHWDEPRFRDR